MTLVVIADLIRNPVCPLHWIPGRAPDDNRVCHCGLDPQSSVLQSWIPDRVRDDNREARDDNRGSGMTTAGPG